MLPWVGRFLMKTSSISVFNYVLADFPFLSFRSLLLTSFHVFLGCPMGKLPLTLMVLHLLDEAFTSILSKWPKQCSFLSCKYFLMLFNFSLVLSSSAKILSSGLMLHIYLTILALFLSSLITSSSLVDQVSLATRIILCTHAEYNLPFAPKGNILLVNKDTKTLNLHHQILILDITLSSAPPLAPIASPR